MNIIFIVLMLGIIVFVHEFGHFVFAKLNHIQVNEFSIGMGPAIMKFQRGDTEYSVRALPIGGYCLMEDNSDDPTNKKAFNNRPVLARLSVALAGPFFNFILAFVLSIFVCHFTYIDPPTLTTVVENSAAEEAGLKEGDTITRLNNDRIYTFRELQLFTMVSDPKEPIDVEYERGGKRYTTSVKLKKDAETGSYLFGIIAQPKDSKGILDDLEFSIYEVRLQIKTTIYSVKMLLFGKLSKDSLMGPVGIGNMMNTVIEDTKENSTKDTVVLNVLLSIVDFTMLISANLGVMNLLPLPALDGGRIMFVLIEGISGKPVPREKVALVNAVGFALLMILMIFVFFNDIGNVLK